MVGAVLNLDISLFSEMIGSAHLFQLPRILFKSNSSETGVLDKSTGLPQLVNFVIRTHWTCELCGPSALDL